MSDSNTLLPGDLIVDISPDGARFAAPVLGKTPAAQGGSAQVIAEISASPDSAGFPAAVTGQIDSLRRQFSGISRILVTSDLPAAETSTLVRSSIFSNEKNVFMVDAPAEKAGTLSNLTIKPLHTLQPITKLLKPTELSAVVNTLSLPITLHGGALQLPQPVTVNLNWSATGAAVVGSTTITGSGITPMRARQQSFAGGVYTGSWAAKFNGSGALAMPALSVPASGAYIDIDADIMLTSTTGRQTFVRTDSFALCVDNGTLSFFLLSGGAWWQVQTSGDLSLEAGTWIDVRATYDGNAMILSVNGIERAAVAAPIAANWSGLWFGTGLTTAQRGTNPALPDECAFSGILGPVSVVAGSRQLLDFRPVTAFRLGSTNGGMGDICGNTTLNLGSGVSSVDGPSAAEPALWFAGSGSANLTIPFALSGLFGAASTFSLSFDLMMAQFAAQPLATLVEFGNFRLDLNSRSLQMHNTASTGTTVSICQIPDFSWVRVDVVQDANGVTCYVDGVQRAYMAGTAASITAPSPLALGGTLAGGSFFKGYMARVALSRGVRPVMPALTSLEAAPNATLDKGVGGITWTAQKTQNGTQPIGYNASTAFVPWSFSIAEDATLAATDAAHVLASQPAWTVEASLSATLAAGDMANLFTCGGFALDIGTGSANSLRVIDSNGPHYFSNIFLDTGAVIRAVHDGVNFSVYVNGELLLQEAGSNVTMPTPAPINIGGYNGDLAYFRIWPEARVPSPAYRTFLTMADGLWHDPSVLPSLVYTPSLRTPQSSDVDLVSYTPAGSTTTTPGLALAYPTIALFLDNYGTWMLPADLAAGSITPPVGAGKHGLLGKYSSNRGYATIDMSTCATWSGLITSLYAAGSDISPATVVRLLDNVAAAAKKMDAMFSELFTYFIVPSNNTHYDLAWSNAPSGSAHLPSWRTQFDASSGVSVADLPTITTSPGGGSLTPTEPISDVLGDWKVMYDAFFKYLNATLTNYLQYSALQAIGYFAVGEQELGQENWNAAQTYYAKAESFMPSLTSDQIAALKNVTIQKAGPAVQQDAHQKTASGAITVNSTSTDDLFTILSNIGLALPFGLNAAHREMALANAANATSDFASAYRDIIYATSTWYRPDSAAFNLLEWLAVASTAMDQGRQAYMNRNLPQARSAFQMVFRSRLAHATLYYDDSTPIDAQVYALRIQAATFLQRIERGDTPFGLSNDYVPKESYPTLLSAANGSISLARKAASDYMISRQQGQTQATQLAALQASLNTQQTNLASAQAAVTSAQSTLTASYSALNAALVKQKEAQQNATIMALYNSAGQLVGDISGLNFSFLTGSQSSTPGKAGAKTNAQQQTGISAAFSSVLGTVTGVKGLIGGVEKAVNDYSAARQKILDAAAKAVSDATKQVSSALGAWSESVATYRNAGAAVSSLTMQKNILSSTQTAFSSAWWYQRADQLSRLAQTWIDLAAIDIWKLQQSAENLLDQGSFPLNFTMQAALNNPDAASPIATDPNMAIYSLATLLRQVDAGDQNYPGFAAGAAALSSTSRSFSLKESAPLQVSGLGYNGGTAIFNITQADLEYALSSSVSGNFHEMVCNVGVRITYNPAPNSLTGSEHLTAQVIAATPSVVRIYDPSSAYAAGTAPITNNGEWFATTPANYKLKQKNWDVGTAQSLQLSPQSSTGSAKLFEGSTSNLTYDGSGAFQGAGLARLWIVQVEGAPWLNWSCVEDVELLFDVSNGPSNTGERYQYRPDFCAAVAASVQSIAPSKNATLYYSAGAPAAGGTFSLNVQSADLGASAQFTPVLQTVTAILVPQTGTTLAAGQVTVQAQGQTVHAAVQLVQGGMAVATLPFTGAPAVAGTYNFTVTEATAGIVNVVVLVEYNYRRQPIVCGA